MTQQLLRYHQPQPKFVRVRAPVRSEKIPVAALVGGIALALGSTNADARPTGNAYATQTYASQAIVARDEEINSADALAEIKMISGLTWTQIAQLLDVSRKRLHDWTAGGNLRDGNQAKVAALLDRVRSLTDLPKFKIRNALLGPTLAQVEATRPLVVSDNTPPRHRRTKLVGSITSG